MRHTKGMCFSVMCHTLNFSFGRAYVRTFFALTTQVHAATFLTGGAVRSSIGGTNIDFSAKLWMRSLPDFSVVVRLPMYEWKREELWHRKHERGSRDSCRTRFFTEYCTSS